MAVDITEDIPYDLSYTADNNKWEPTKAAYDISINNIPFFLRIDNQNPYVRETAPFKKDQFDSSNEPGEQSLTGWWLRSQTSWHDGAGITYYEPGVEQNVLYRFSDSRGVDVWNIGELRMLPDVYYGYSPAGVSGFHACEANDGTSDCIILGSNNGALNKLSIVANDTPMSATPYTIASHTSYPFLSVTTDGTYYYAVCSRGIHKGTISSASSDTFLYKHSTVDVTNAFAKFVKGVLIFSGRSDYPQRIMPLTTTRTTSAGHTTGAIDASPATASNYFTHSNDKWIWVDATSSASDIYIAGRANGHSEIYAIGFDDVTNEPDFAGAQMVIKLPFGEVVNKIEYRLGSLVIATSKGIRIASVDLYGNLILGPLTFRCEDGTQCYGISSKDNYVYIAAQATGTNGTKNAILVRIDLSNQLDDGTFAWAYDLEYKASDGDITKTTEVYSINNQMVMIVDEAGTGEIQIEHTTKKVTTGYIDTGIIRYGTVEPKFFKYIKVNGIINSGDFITVSSYDESKTYTSVDSLNQNLIGSDISMTSIKTSRESAGFRFTFTNVSPYTTAPVLTSYQIKALPASKRQRIIQLPLSCFDVEMDRYNSTVGYQGSAYDKIKTLETLEEIGDIVSITDYRTNETYDAIIENTSFTVESSPDKNNNGFGGTLVVTVRKL